MSKMAAQLSFTVAAISLFLLLSTQIDSSFCLRCYDCASPLGLNLYCETDLQKENSKICSVGAVCAKYIINNPGEKVLTRGCGPATICQDLANNYVNNPAVTVGECKTCEIDDCNGSGDDKITRDSDGTDNGAFSVVSGGFWFVLGSVLLGVF